MRTDGGRAEERCRRNPEDFILFNTSLLLHCVINKNHSVLVGANGVGVAPT